MRYSFIFLLIAACAGDPWRKDAGCTELHPADPAFTGWKVMECAHPFAVPSGNPTGCQNATREASGAHGPLLPCGWVRGYTDRAARTVYVWELYPEVLDHERLHVLNAIAEDR
jgi:hypothetical protein